jgi:hypothetical protein
MQAPFQIRPSNMQVTVFVLMPNRFAISDRGSPFVLSLCISRATAAVSFIPRRLREFTTGKTQRQFPGE